MSRFHFDAGDETDIPPGFWEQALKNALRSQRGQTALRELKEALLALPSHRLIEGKLAQEGEVCALGALAVKRLREGSLTVKMPWREWTFTAPAELETEIAGQLEDEHDSMAFGVALGLRRTLAWEIAYQNDEAGPSKETPEERWSRVLRWVESRLRPVG